MAASGYPAPQGDSEDEKKFFRKDRTTQFSGRVAGIGGNSKFASGQAVEPAAGSAKEHPDNPQSISHSQLNNPPDVLGIRESLLTPFAIFRELQLGSVCPQGWLQQELTKQADGIATHQPDFCFPFDRRYWASNERGQDEESRNGGTFWWAATAGSRWNYGLALDSGIAADRQVRVNTIAVGEDPCANPPIHLEVSARTIVNGKLVRMRRDDPDWFQTPPLPLEKDQLGTVETIKLVPLGSTHLCVTVFPSLNADESNGVASKSPSTT